MENNNSNIKICIAGVGAIGGILAATLGKKYGENVSLIAHGARAESLRKNGVVLHSEVLGEITAKVGKVEEDGAKLGKQDLIFVCVKNYSLDAICEQIRPCITENTVIIPVMNGVEPGDRLRAAFPDAIVDDALIYTTTGANADYSITQNGTYTYIYIGSAERDERHINGAKMAYDLLLDAGLDARYTDDIEAAIWRKYILNCAFNTVTARYLATSADIRTQQSQIDDFKSLLTEAYTVAVKSGIKVDDDLVQQHMDFMLEKQSPKATSSLRRDVEAKRPTELDAFLGALIRKADALGIDVPVSRRYFKEIGEMEAAYTK